MNFLVKLQVIGLSGVELSVTKVNDSPELHLRFCDSPRCILFYDKCK